MPNRWRFLWGERCMLWGCLRFPCTVLCSLFSPTPSFLLVSLSLSSIPPPSSSSSTFDLLRDPGPQSDILPFRSCLWPASASFPHAPSPRNLLRPPACQSTCIHARTTKIRWLGELGTKSGGLRCPLLGRRTRGAPLLEGAIMNMIATEED
jgi:hypothetical protein